MRDSQREKVYQAEYALRDLFDTAEHIGNREVELDGIRLTLPMEYKFAGVADVQSYCDQVSRMVGARGVAVRERAGESKAHYQAGVIAVPDNLHSWAKREIVILHELAHHLSPGDRHGPGFVATFTDLLSKVMGVEVGLAYRVLCSHSGAREGVRA